METLAELRLVGTLHTLRGKEEGLLTLHQRIRQEMTRGLRQRIREKMARGLPTLHQRIRQEMTKGIHLSIWEEMLLTLRQGIEAKRQFCFVVIDQTIQ